MMRDFDPTDAKRHCQRGMLRPVMTQLKSNKKKLRVLCLPSKHAWDLTFFGKHKSVGEMIGLEEKPKDAAGLVHRCIRRHKVRIVCAHTNDYLAHCPSHKFDVIYLDYMANFSDVGRIDFEYIFEKKLIRVGGFFIVTLYCSRGNKSCNARMRSHYRDFSKALGHPCRSKIKHKRMLMAAWNGVIGNRHMLPGLNGHYIHTTIPEWHGYQAGISGPMISACVQVLSYPRKDRTAQVLKRSDEWLRRGKHHLYKKYEDDGSCALE